MEWLGTLWDLIVHLDRHLAELLRDYGLWTYAILFGIVFVETGLVVMPFLPGDSLLFAVGALAIKGDLSVPGLIASLWLAAFLGNQVNYHIGRFLGPKVFTDKHRKFFKREHLERTHRFYEKYGPMTIILARFVPIVRTFAPFVAGIGSMDYIKFTIYNLVGGGLWVASLIFVGYFFGETEFVKNNFTVVFLAVLIVPALPAIIGFVMGFLREKKAAPGAPVAAGEIAKEEVE